MMLWVDDSVEVLWCNWTLFCVLADGIANFIIYLWLLLYYDRCYCHWARCFEAHLLFVIMFHGVIGPCGCQGVTRLLMLWSCYLSLSSGDLTNTSSHICGSWYLPIFLLRDGSLTLMSIASLMDLAILWSYLPTVLKVSRERSWPVVLVVVMDGWGGPHVFSEPFCKSSAWFPNIFFTVHPATLISVDHPTFLEGGVFVLIMYQEVLDGTASFKVHINAMFPADVLATLTHSLNIGHHYVGIVVVEACVVPSVIGILVGSVGFLLFYACPI